MYLILPPHPSLAPYIDNYWFLNTQRPADDALREQIFVDVRADILFNFGAAYVRESADGTVTTLAASNVDAPRDQPVSVVQSGHVRLVGVRFKPGGLAAFVPMPVGHLLNLTAETGDVLGAVVHELESRLYDAPTAAAQKILLDGFFLSRLSPPNKYTLAQAVIRRLDAGDTTRIDQLAGEFGYSARTLDRVFTQVVGVPPKVYARIARFQRALALLTQPIALTEVALAAGYFDQPHLTREFRALAGQTPERTRADLIARLPDPAPNLVRFVQDPSQPPAV